jgi:YgiT-type zinc finger domain-containing protein
MSKPILYIDLHKMRSGQYFPNDYVSDHALPGYTAFVPQEGEPPRLLCVACGGANVTEDIVTETMTVGLHEHREVIVRVPLMTCHACGMQWSDERGEKIRDDAARKLQGGIQQ